MGDGPDGLYHVCWTGCALGDGGGGPADAALGLYCRRAVRHNHDFHTTIAEIGGNPFLANWMSGLLDQGQRILRLYARNRGDKVPDSVLKPHRDMVDAIAAGDADRAEAAGRADAEALMEEYKRNLSNRPAALLLLEASPSRKQ